jgi:hypothetical protein
MTPWRLTASSCSLRSRSMEPRLTPVRPPLCSSIVNVQAIAEEYTPKLAARAALSTLPASRELDAQRNIAGTGLLSSSHRPSRSPTVRLQIARATSCRCDGLIEHAHCMILPPGIVAARTRSLSAIEAAWSTEVSSSNRFSLLASGTGPRIPFGRTPMV